MSRSLKPSLPRCLLTGLFISQLLICVLVLSRVHMRQHAVLDAAVVIAAPQAHDVLHAPPEAFRRLLGCKALHHARHSPHREQLHPGIQRLHHGSQTFFACQYCDKLLSLSIRAVIAKQHGLHLCMRTKESPENPHLCILVRLQELEEVFISPLLREVQLLAHEHRRRVLPWRGRLGQDQLQLPSLRVPCLALESPSLGAMSFPIILALLPG